MKTGSVITAATTEHERLMEMLRTVHAAFYAAQRALEIECRHEAAIDLPSGTAYCRDCGAQRHGSIEALRSIRR